MWTWGLREGKTSDGVMPLLSGPVRPSHAHISTRGRPDQTGGGESFWVASPGNRHLADVKKKKKAEFVPLISPRDPSWMLIESLAHTKNLNITWLSVCEEQMYSLLFQKAYQGRAEVTVRYCTTHTAFINTQ